MADSRFVDSAGVSRPPSISECWGDRITGSLVMRLLCGAWLVPAASLIWIGLATTGIRHSSEASEALALGRTQACAVVLALFTVLIGASVFARLAPAIGELDDPSVRPQGGCDLGWLVSHVVGAGVAMACVLVGITFETTGPLLFPAAAVAGFWAGLALPRALVRQPGAWSGPLAALAVGVAFQLTVGWLHVTHPAAAATPLLIAEGLILAWGAASAARIDPFALPAVSAIPARPAERAGSAAGFSQRPAQ